MNAGDEELLGRLAAQAAEDVLDDDLIKRLEALSDGKLTPEEREQLEQEAARSPEVARAYAAYKPMSIERQSRIVDAVSAKVTSSKRAAPALGRRLRSWLAWSVPLVAVTAGLALFVRPGPSPDSAPLPAYELEVAGGERRERAPDGPMLFRSDSPLELTLVPEQAVAGAIAARGFVEGVGGVRELALTTSSLGKGVLRLASPTGALAGAPAGPVRIHVIVGRSAPVAAVQKDALLGAFVSEDGVKHVLGIVQLEP